MVSKGNTFFAIQMHILTKEDMINQILVYNILNLLSEKITIFDVYTILKKYTRWLS